MAVKQVVPGVYSISLGAVNAFLIHAGELILVDTGTPGSSEKILAAVQELGSKPEDIRHILVTHCHADHSGSLAALRRATGAPAYMHPIDAAMVRQGKAKRPMTPAPGLMNKILYQVFVRNSSGTVEPSEIEHEVNDGDVLPMAGGIQAIHVPGHCAGQLAFLWPRGNLLFAADAAGSVRGVRLSVVYEDLEEGKRSLARLAGYNFEAACFGHGPAITRNAAGQFRQKWGTESRPTPARV